MAWTTPKTWVLDEVVDETDLNTHVRDNLRALYPDYGTSLPGSPYTDKQAILTDSTSAPTYRWHLRYNAAISDAYKWEFIGGTWQVVSCPYVNQANIQTYRFTATVATVAVGGIYETVVRSHAIGGTSPNSGLWTIGVNGAADDTYAGGSRGEVFWNWNIRTLAAGDALSLAYRETTGSVSSSLEPAGEILLKPVRIG